MTNTIPTDAEREALATRLLAEARTPERHLALALAHVNAAYTGVLAAMHAADPHLPEDHPARTHARRAAAALGDMGAALRNAGL